MTGGQYTDTRRQLSPRTASTTHLSIRKPNKSSSGHIKKVSHYRKLPGAWRKRLMGLSTCQNHIKERHNEKSSKVCCSRHVEEADKNRGPCQALCKWVTSLDIQVSHRRSLFGSIHDREPCEVKVEQLPFIPSFHRGLYYHNCGCEWHRFCWIWEFDSRTLAQLNSPGWPMTYSFIIEDKIDQQLSDTQHT